MASQFGFISILPEHSCPGSVGCHHQLGAVGGSTYHFLLVFLEVYIHKHFSNDIREGTFNEVHTFVPLRQQSCGPLDYLWEIIEPE